MENLGERHWLRPSRSGVWASALVTLEPKSPRRRPPGAVVPALRCSNLPHPPASAAAAGPGAHSPAARRRGPGGGWVPREKARRWDAASARGGGGAGRERWAVGGGGAQTVRSGGVPAGPGVGGAC